MNLSEEVMSRYEALRHKKEQVICFQIKKKVFETLYVPKSLVMSKTNIYLGVNARTKLNLNQTKEVCFRNFTLNFI